jgi:hypothetical protein
MSAMGRKQTWSIPPSDPQNPALPLPELCTGLVARSTTLSQPLEPSHFGALLNLNLQKVIRAVFTPLHDRDGRHGA